MYVPELIKAEMDMLYKQAYLFIQGTTMMPENILWAEAFICVHII